MPGKQEKSLSPQVKREHPLWMEVLNEHNYWNSDDEIMRWFGDFARKPEPDCDPQLIQEFKNTLNQIRFLIYAHHFGKALDFQWLNNELSNLSLSFLPPPSIDSPLPYLRGKELAASDSELLKSLRLSILVTFAADFARVLSGESEWHLHRCEGLFRNSEGAHVVHDDAAETSWRNEIEMLIASSSHAAETSIQRCADFFFAKSRSKYCSDACRFSTFQVSKQISDPSYLAEKQKRYRNKKS